jgi:general secretion pathway protein A
VYQVYFGLTERPFSIAPDPQYLYMSSRHKEAMAHLSYGLTQGGCFIVLTGEVGTGKTTLCRNLLAELPENLDVALILNANINEQELLQTICDELQIDYQQDTSQKQLLDRINEYLLETFAQNRHTVLIIDEAQLLSRDVLEQIRLLTNLETTKSKLLQIILIGQPELNDVLARNDLRQLAQRVTARYHLGPLRRNEIEGYIHFRLSVAGCKKPLFSKQALTRLHDMTEGIPRRINVLADHALLAAYSNDRLLVDAKMVKAAAKDVFIKTVGPEKGAVKFPKWALSLLLLALLNIGLWWYFSGSAYSIPAQPSTSADIQKPAIAAQVDTSMQATIKPDETKNSVIQQARSLHSSDLIEDQTKFVPDPQSINSSSDDKTVDVSFPQSTDAVSIQPGVVIVSDELLDSSTQLPPSIDIVSAKDTLSASALSTPPTSTSNQEVNATNWKGSDLAQLLETSADVTGGIVAARQLARMWQLDLPEKMLKSPCQVVQQNGLSCLNFTTVEKLQLYNRPSIVALSNKNQLFRVIVESIGPDTATLRVGGSNAVISRTELEARWAGDGLLYWRPDQAGSAILEQGSEGAGVVRVRDLLNRALSATGIPLLNSIEATQFDLDMSQKVFTLQSRFGITSDSKIGNETYMLMNEIVSPDTTPVIRNRLR